MKENKDYTQSHDDKGRFVKGNPGGGRNIGSFNNAINQNKTLHQKRAAIQQKWVEKIEENADEIFDLAIHLCRTGSEKALLALLPTMVSKPKDYDNEKKAEEVDKSPQTQLMEIRELHAQIELKMKALEGK